MCKEVTILSKKRAKRAKYKIPLRQQSLDADKESNFLSIKKSTAFPLFCFIERLGQGNFTRGILSYECFATSFRTEIAELYYITQVDSSLSLSSFYRDSGVSKDYKSIVSFIQSVKNCGFSTSDGFPSLWQFKKMHRLVKVIRKQKSLYPRLYERLLNTLCE